MPSNTLPIDPLIQLVIDLLNKTGPTELRGRYINGDVSDAKAPELPLCYIAKDRYNRPASKQHGRLSTWPSLWLQLFTTGHRTLNKSYDMAAGFPKLYDMVEGRNADLSLKERTLFYQLRKAQQLAQNAWLGVGSTVDADYGIGINRRGPGSFSIEATIKFTVRVHTPRPGFIAIALSVYAWYY